MNRNNELIILNPINFDANAEEVAASLGVSEQCQFRQKPHLQTGAAKEWQSFFQVLVRPYQALRARLGACRANLLRKK